MYAFFQITFCNLRITPICHHRNFKQMIVIISSVFCKTIMRFAIIYMICLRFANSINNNILSTSYMNL